MKVVIKSTIPPSELANHLILFPLETWDHFKDNNREGNFKVQKQLKLDQKGLCAYCEIDLTEYDFRVEHFHPKSSTDRTRNWGLDWNNLLGVCHGGSVAYVDSGSSGPRRFMPPHFSCDVPKSDKVLNGIILNPTTDISPLIRIFDFNDISGEIFVNQACPQNLRQKATQTLIQLNLNNERLNRLRLAALAPVQDNILDLVETKGLSMEDAFKESAEALFNPRKSWPAFFTSIRAYLAPSSEQHLVAIGYAG